MGQAIDPSNFGFRDFACKHAGDSDTIVVDVQHDPDHVLLPEEEHRLQDMNDEFSRGVVIIVQKNPKQPRTLEFFIRFDLRDRASVVMKPLRHTVS